MVSSNSLKKARKEFEAWRKYHPTASSSTNVKKGLQQVGRGLEFKVTKGTLPSVVVPTPDYIVNRIDNKKKR